MAIQPGSPDTYQADRIAAMQQQIQGLPTKKDQQEIVTQQKSIAASLEQLLVILEAGNANTELIEQIGKFREDYNKDKTLSTDSIHELQNALQEANELSIKNNDQIVKALSQYVSDSEDRATQVHFQLLKEAIISGNKDLSTILKDTSENIKKLQEDVLYNTAPDKDKERLDEKSRKLFAEKLFGFADKVLFYLENLWNRFKPTWADFFKMMWAWFAPQILGAFRGFVDHLGPLTYLKVIADKYVPALYKQMQFFAKIFDRISHGFSSIAGLKGHWNTLPDKLVTKFMDSELGKKFRNSKFGSAVNKIMLKTEEITSPFTNWFKETKLGKFGSSAADKIAKGFSKAGDVVSSIAGGLSKGASKISQAYDWLGNKIRRFNKLLSIAERANRFEAKKAMQVFRSGIGNYLKSIFNSGSNVAKKTVSFTEKISSKLNPVLKHIAKFTGAIKGISKIIGRFALPLTIAIDAFLGAMRTSGNWFDKLRGAIANVIAGFMSFIQMLWNGTAWIAEHILGKDSLLGKWFNTHKMSDMQTKQVGAALVGLDTTVKENGKIGYQTQKEAGKSQGGLWNNTKAFIKNLNPLNKDNTAYNEDKSMVPRSENGDELGDGTSKGWASKLGKLAWAHKNGIGYVKGRDGRCAKYVRENIQNTLGAKVANQIRSASAYQMADKFKNNPEPKKFWDFAGNKKHSEMKNLPAGSVVVWPRAGKSKHGHVEIADGKGHLISDYARPATNVMYRTPGLLASVFTPKGTSLSFSPSSESSSEVFGGFFDKFKKKKEDDGSSTQEDTLSDNPMADAEQEEQYTMANAIQDIIAASIGLENSSAESEAIYGSSRKSSSPFSKSTNMQTDSGSERVASSKPVPVTINEPVVYDRPQIDDITLIQQQMALPVT